MSNYQVLILIQSLKVTLSHISHVNYSAAVFSTLFNGSSDSSNSGTAGVRAVSRTHLQV